MHHCQTALKKPSLFLLDSVQLVTSSLEGRVHSTDRTSPLMRKSFGHVLPHLVIEPVLLLQRAEVLQAQCVLVVCHHEARNRSGGQPDPVPSHLLFDVHSTALEEITQELNIYTN